MAQIEINTGAMGRVTVEFLVASNKAVLDARAAGLPCPSDRMVELTGTIDTGATRLVLPAKAVAQLGLIGAGQTTVRYADGRSATREMVSNVWLSLQGREGVFSAILEPDRETALIGAIVLEELDLVVDCPTQSIHPRDPDRIVSEVE
jgi:predicted aspartyl protease